MTLGWFLVITLILMLLSGFFLECMAIILAGAFFGGVLGAFGLAVFLVFTGGHGILEAMMMGGVFGAMGGAGLAYVFCSFMSLVSMLEKIFRVE